MSNNKEKHKKRAKEHTRQTVRLPLYAHWEEEEGLGVGPGESESIGVPTSEARAPSRPYPFTPYPHSPFFLLPHPHTCSHTHTKGA